MNLVLYARGRIDLAALCQQAKLWSEVLRQRQIVSQRITAAINVCNLYKDEELAVKTKRLRHEIRLFTKGTGTVYALDAVTERLYIHEGNEQLYNANSILLKSAYRKLALLTHPDKGGDPKLFHAVNEAYRNRDLTFMRELWITLNRQDDLFWRQSEGLDYALQEIQRPEINWLVFKGNPLFAVNRLHTIGNTRQAKIDMVKFQKSLNARLFNELTHLKEKYYGKGQEIQEGKGTEESSEEGKRKGRQEGQGQDRQEGSQGFQFGEGPIG